MIGFVEVFIATILVYRKAIYWTVYRWFMRWAHKHDWHYAPLIGPFEDGATQRRCKWCGFRETYRPRAGFKNLRTSDAEPKFESYPYNDVVTTYDGNWADYEETPCVNP